MIKTSFVSSFESFSPTQKKQSRNLLLLRLLQITVGILDQGKHLRWSFGLVTMIWATLGMMDQCFSTEEQERTVIKKII